MGRQQLRQGVIRRKLMLLVGGSLRKYIRSWDVNLKGKYNPLHLWFSRNSYGVACHKFLLEAWHLVAFYASGNQPPCTWQLGWEQVLFSQCLLTLWNTTITENSTNPPCASTRELRNDIYGYWVPIEHSKESIPLLSQSWAAAEKKEY